MVIDFIDMNEERNRKKIVDRLIDEVRRDRAKVSVSSRLSEFGLLEMTRQRVRPNLLHDTVNLVLSVRALGALWARTPR